MLQHVLFHVEFTDSAYGNGLSQMSPATNLDFSVESSATIYAVS